MVFNAMEKLKSPIRQNDFGGLMGTNYRWRTSGVSSHGNSAANLTYSGKYAGSEYAYQSGSNGPIAYSHLAMEIVSFFKNTPAILRYVFFITLFTFTLLCAA